MGVAGPLLAVFDDGPEGEAAAQKYISESWPDFGTVAQQPTTGEQQ